MKYRNILIVKLSAIGDVIHALPVAHALKQCRPDARITWMVEKPAFDVLNHNPDINEILLFDKQQFKSLAGFWQHAPDLIRGLKARRFDLALDLQGLLKSAAIAWFSGAPRRLVYENAREGSHLFAERIVGVHHDGHIVERYLDVARALGCTVGEVSFPIVVTDREADQAVQMATHAGLQLTKPYVVLAPGANWSNKCWPVTHFAALCDRLYSRQAIPVLTGGPKDRLLADQITARTEVPPVDLTGRTSLKQLAHIIRHARGFVGGDTGPMHLAAALGTPVVALMGPTNPERNGPYGEGHQILLTPEPCKACWKRKCPQNKDCLAGIRVQEVYDAVGQWLA